MSSLKDGARGVISGPRVGQLELRNLTFEMGNLCLGLSHVAATLRQEVGQRFAIKGKAVIVGKTLQKVVFGGGTLAEIMHRGDRVFLDRFVRRFPTNARFDRFHHDRGRQQEGEIVGVFFLNNGGVGVHLAQNSQEGLVEAIHREEGVREHHSADHRAGNVPFIPLIASETGGHREVAFQDRVEAIDPLAGAGIHLVGHRGGPGLPLRKAFRGRLVTRHEAEGLGEGGRTAGEIDEGRHDAEVERARVDLADIGPGLREAEVFADLLVKRGHFFGVTIEERNLVHLGAHRALESTHGVGLEDGIEIVKGAQDFLAEHREALTKGRRLRCDIVGAGRDHEVGPLGGALREAR